MPVVREQSYQIDFAAGKVRVTKVRDACAGLVGGLILSLIWMILLRFSAGLMAWLLIIAVNLTFAACTLLAFTKVHSLPLLACLPLFVMCTINAKHIQDLLDFVLVQAGILGNFGAVGMYVRDQIPLSEDPSAHDRKIWQISAYVAVGLTGLLIIFTLVIIRRVKACPAAHATPH